MDGLTVEHFGQVRELGKCPFQILQAPGSFARTPKIIGATGEQCIGADGGILNTGAHIVLDDLEERIAADGDFESLDIVFL